MGARPLGPDEAALWARVMATVRPLHAAAASEKPAPPAAPEPRPAVARTAGPAPAPPPATPARGPGKTLDGGWDRRIGRGEVAPDTTIDLHGHSLASAYAVLDEGLSRAIGRGDRVLLLVTGKPPRPDSERPHARGAIRAAIADWLAASRHADAIAAVRGAHPRHGGTGALYLVLRRRRALPIS